MSDRMWSLRARAHFHKSDGSQKKKRNNNGKDTLNVAKRCRFDILSYIYQIQCDVPCMLNVDRHVCGLESQNVIELRVNQEYE